MKKVIAAALLACLVVGLGCAALSEIVTPATIDRHAVNYAVSAGVADVNDFAGYGNLLKAKQLATAVEGAYQVKTLGLQQLVERNRLDYDLVNGVAQRNLSMAQQREEALFGEKGLLSVGLTLIGAGGLGGLLGLMRKRPGDWTPKEVDTALADSGVATVDKTRQLTEVVQGVQAFLDLHPKSDPIGADLRMKLSMAQSADTEAAVAVAKVS
jgi:hypothetical protein